MVIFPNHSDVHTGECDRHPFSNSMLWVSWPRRWITCGAWWFAMELRFRVWYCLYRKPDVGKILCTMHESPALGSPSLPPYIIQYTNPPPFMLIFNHHISSARSVMHVFIFIIVCVIFIHPWDSCHGQHPSARSSRLSLRRWHCPSGWEPRHWSPVGHGYGSCTVCSQQASFCLFFVLLAFHVDQSFCVFLWSKYMFITNTQTTKPNQQLRVTWWRVQRIKLLHKNTPSESRKIAKHQH